MDFTGDETVDMPREQLFDFFTDLRNEPKWNKQCLEMVPRGGDVSGLVVWESRYKPPIGSGQVVTTEFDRPKAVAWQVSSTKMDLDMQCTFEDAGNDRTRMQTTMNIIPKGLMRLMAPLMKPMLRKDMATKAQQVVDAWQLRERSSIGN